MLSLWQEVEGKVENLLSIEVSNSRLPLHPACGRRLQASRSLTDQYLNIYKVGENNHEPVTTVKLYFKSFSWASIRDLFTPSVSQMIVQRGQ